jgi:hypothetical protein
MKQFWNINLGVDDDIGIGIASVHDEKPAVIGGFTYFLEAVGKRDDVVLLEVAPVV